MAREAIAARLRDQMQQDAAARNNGSSPTAWPGPMDAAALHGLAGRVVREISPHTEADPVALLVSYLAAAGAIIGRGPHYRVEGTEHHALDYFALAGDSSKARKGTSWGRVRQIVERVDPEWVRTRTDGGLSTGEGLLWEVRNPVIKRVKETEGKGSAKQWTGRWVEEEEDPGIDDKRLLIQESELARMFAVFERPSDTLSAILRELWDKGSAAARARTAPARTSGAHVAILAHVPIEELQLGLTRVQSGNGFGNRFCWFCVRRARVLPFGGELDDATISELAADTADRVREARQIGRVQMDASARELWTAVYEPLSAGKPGMLGAITARGEAHVIRLALLYALLDGSASIRTVHLEAGLAVWDYAERSARHIWGEATGHPLADEILRALQSRPAGMTRTEIRELVGGSVEAVRIDDALALLERYLLGRRQVEETPGRPAERWIALNTTAPAGEGSPDDAPI